MAQNNATVQFCYVPTTGTLPSNRDENTIYFDAAGKGLYVGTNQIAADNAAQDLSGFVTNTALATILNDYVTKDDAAINGQLLIQESSGGVGNLWHITRETTGFSFGVWDDLEDGIADAKLSGIATPTANNDAATKGYVDAAIANLPTPTTITTESTKISYNLISNLPTITSTAITINNPSNYTTFDDLVDNINNIELEITGPNTGAVINCKTFYYDANSDTPTFTFGPFSGSNGGVFEATILPNSMCWIEKVI